MINKYHNAPIVVAADKPDWGKRWGIAAKSAKGCWCYNCTMKFLNANPEAEAIKKYLKREADRWEDENF